MPKVKILRVNSMDRHELIKTEDNTYKQIKDILPELPNFSKTGSVIGMKRKYYGVDALLVRYGSFIYNVSSYPEIYNLAH